MPRMLQIFLLSVVLIAPVMGSISDGPDINGQRDKSCGNIIVDVLIDGVTTRYIVPDGPGRLERFQKQLFDADLNFGQVMHMVNQVRKGLRELDGGGQFSSVKNLTKPAPKPGCGQCKQGRDPDVIPPMNCIVGLRPFNCTACTVCG